MDITTICAKGFVTIQALLMDREEAGIQAAEDLAKVMCQLPWPGQEQYSHNFKEQLQELIDKYPYLSDLFKQYTL